MLFDLSFVKEVTSNADVEDNKFDDVVSGPNVVPENIHG